MPDIILNHDQKIALKRFIEFIESSSDKIFILKGYAGTGKTTVMKFFLKELSSRECVVRLLASTGRAAKILANATTCEASTIHSQLYKFDDFNKDLEEVLNARKDGVDKSGQLLLSFMLNPITPEELNCKRVYIVDEASMVSDVAEENPLQAVFGSGKLLTDLLEYDVDAKFVFVGDECQLPPINQTISPALNVAYFRDKFHLNPVIATLSEIMRQQHDNDIISAATKIRSLYANPPQVKWGKLPLKGLKNITLHADSKSLISEYVERIKNGDYNCSTYIAPSNRRCLNANQLIRSALGRKGYLDVGDLIMITQNNLISRLMNGDLCVVEQISDTVVQKAYLTFRQVELRELVSGRTVSQYIIEDILYGSRTNLMQSQQKELFIDFYIRMKEKGIKQKTEEFIRQLHEDEFLNALRAVHGYALTCHKAQGGEWSEVFVDFPRNITLDASAASYQWIYTAVTRAKNQLHVVNDFFISD